MARLWQLSAACVDGEMGLDRNVWDNTHGQIMLVRHRSSCALHFGVARWQCLGLGRAELAPKHARADHAHRIVLSRNVWHPMPHRRNLRLWRIALECLPWRNCARITHEAPGTRACKVLCRARLGNVGGALTHSLDTALCCAVLS